MPEKEVDLIHPTSIRAFEAYRAGQPGPIMYERGCGVIVIWSGR